MAEPVDRQALLATLTTEHFTLQGARGSTVAESSARAALYLGSLSASLVSLGFLAQLSAAGETFRVFALVVLPTLYVLGIFTFVRLVETSVEDLLYGRAINRIRNYYLQLAGPESRYFMLSGHDDAIGVLHNMGLRPTRAQLYFTSSSMVAFVNSVVGGSAFAVLVWWSADSSLGAAAGAGGAAAAISAVLHMHWTRHRHLATSPTEILFPTPDASAS
jgi:hypothetical protein